LFDGLAKSPEFVMPDLIWHPEHTEITGFRLLDRVQHRPRRNDALREFQTFYEIVIVWDFEFRSLLFVWYLVFVIYYL
jgi:hypothetical protein